MCKKKHYCNREVDDCLKKTIERINKYSHYKTLACCCGHGVYNPSIIIKNKDNRQIFEFFSRIKLELKKRNRFYKKDKKGYYFIPEILRFEEQKVRETGISRKRE